MSQLLTIKLSKGPGASWGFRLQGGKDFAQPLCIQKVNVGSVAEGAGLQAGDAIVSIGGGDALSLRHKEAQDAIVKAGSSFQMVVQRGAMNWKPQVTALSQPKKTAEGPVATQTSLAAKQATKYNSPINLYNEDNIAEALSSQSEVLGKGCLGINFRKFDREVKLRTDSPTYQLIHGDESAAGGYKPRKQLPPQEEAQQQSKPVFPTPQPGQQGPGSGLSSPVPSAYPGSSGPTRSVQAPVTRPRAEGAVPAGGATVCSQCDLPIIGVFVRIKDKNLHADCFKCNTCGSSLKNVGYYNINDKLYCDAHAKQAAKHNPPGPNMVPVTVKPGAIPPPGAMPIAAAMKPAAPAPQAFVPEPAPVVEEVRAAPAPAPVESVPQETTAAEEPQLPTPVTEECAPIVHEPAVAPVDEPAAPAEQEASAEQSTDQPPAEVAKEVAEPEVAAVEVTESEAPPCNEPLELESQEPAVVEQSEPVAEHKTEPQADPEPEVQNIESQPEEVPQVAEPEPQPEPEPELVPEPEPEYVAAPPEEGAVTEEKPVVSRSVAAPEPAPTFAPPPIPAPAFVQQPPAGGSSANPAAFGAPTGGINVRSHIPKKAACFIWPPGRGHSEESVGSHSPSWAPVGEVLKVPMPVHTGGPPPKVIPLLPTPPPPKDYEGMVLSSTTVHQQNYEQQQQQQVNVVQQSSSSVTTQQKSVVQTSFESKSTVTASAVSSTTNISSSQMINASGGIVKNIMKGKISPPKSVPVTTPMPSVNFGPNVALPSTAPMKPIIPKVEPPQLKPDSALLPGGIKKSASVPGVKSVKAPVPAPKKSESSFGFKPVTPKFGGPSKQEPSKPVAASVPISIAPPAPKPIDPASLPFAIAPLTVSPIPVVTPAPAAIKLAPKPAASQPPKPAGPVAPVPAPAPVPVFSAPKPAAPAPAPAPMFGGGMPKPAPPPGMGGMAKPPGSGGPPTKGVPGERTAPKRGRGVMNPAAASRIPICANCQRQIRGPFVTALGKNWCPDHFHCATDSCRKPLIDLGFVEEQGALYCENCYEQYLAPTCGKCDKRIKGDCLNAVGKQFHPECFCCAYCGKVFGSGAFYLEDGLPYCETDWNDLFTTKCVGCGFPIEAGDRWVEALNNNYHSQCFKCSKCHKNLEGQSFFAKGGKPFCKAHAQRGF